nr:MAG TPA: hypothetical protein [Bacteriophage sp.]
MFLTLIYYEQLLFSQWQVLVLIRSDLISSNT